MNIELGSTWHSLPRYNLQFSTSATGAIDDTTILESIDMQYRYNMQFIITFGYLIIPLDVYTGGLTAKHFLNLS